MDRTKLIGASDIPSLFNKNPFCTALKLWAIKTGEIEQDDLSDNEAVEWGTRLERVVSDKFSEKHNVKLIARKARYVHQEMSFFSCELDNIIAGTDEIVEIKTVNAFAWKKWENPDELPESVILQVTAQMGLSKRNKAWVACLCGGQKYIEKEIPFDPELYKIIEDKVREFWVLVENKTPPIAVGADNEIIVDIYPDSSPEMKEASEDISEGVAQLQLVKAEIIELEKQKDELEAKIKQVIGESAGIRTPQYVVKWTPTKTTRIDTEKLKQAGIYEQYSKISETKRLTVNKNNIDKPKSTVWKYITKGDINV